MSTVVKFLKGVLIVLAAIAFLLLFAFALIYGEDASDNQLFFGEQSEE